MKIQLGTIKRPWTSAYIYVMSSTANPLGRRVSALSNLKIIKAEVSNLIENLEVIDSDDLSLNKLHSRVYSLKMSLLNVDKELQELNFLTKKDIQRSQTLISLKDFYQKELRSLEMVL